MLIGKEWQRVEVRKYSCRRIENVTQVCARGGETGRERVDILIGIGEL